MNVKVSGFPSSRCFRFRAANHRQRRGQVVEKVEETRIEMADISSTMVAQIMVEVV